MSRSEMCALWAFLAALAMVSSLRWVLPIDEGVFQWRAGLNPEEPGVGLAAFRYIRLYPRA